MIYLQNKQSAQDVFIPARGKKMGGIHIFRADSTIDLEQYVNSFVRDGGTSDTYYKISVTLSAGIPNGEYTYTLIKNAVVDGKTQDVILSSGLLVIGENFTPSEYDKEISYEQYTTQ